MSRFILILFLCNSSLISAQINIETSEAYSPAILATGISISYNMPVSDVVELLDYLVSQGVTSRKGQKLAVNFISGYSDLQSDEDAFLSDFHEKYQIEIPEYLIVNMKTSGIQSPQIYSQGNVYVDYNLNEAEFWDLFNTVMSINEKSNLEINELEKALKNAHEDYLKSREDLKNQPDSISQKAYAYFIQGESALAERLLNKNIPKRETPLVTDYIVMGRMLKRKWQLDSAYFILHKAYTISSNEPEVVILYGGVLLTLRRPKDAIEVFQKALDLSLIKYDHAIILNLIGRCYQELNEKRKALQSFKEILNLYPSILTEPNKYAAIVLGNLGYAYQRLAKTDSAIYYTEKSLAINLEIFGEDHPEVAVDYNNLSGMYLNGVFSGRKVSQISKSFKYLKKAYLIDSAYFGVNHPKLARRFVSIGGIEQKMGHSSRAIYYFNRALKIDSMVYGANSYQVASDYMFIGEVYCMQLVNYPRTIEYFTKALNISALDNRLDSTRVGHSNYYIAFANQRMGLNTQAINYASNAFEIYCRLPENYKIHPNAISTSTIINIPDLIGSSMTRTNPDSALYYNNLGFNWSKKAEDKTQQVKFMLKIACDHRELGQYTSSMAWNNDCLRLVLDENNVGLPKTNTDLFKNLSAMGSKEIRLLLFNEALTLKQMGNKMKSKKYFKQLNKHAENNDDSQLLTALNNLDQNALKNCTFFYNYLRQL